MTSHFKVRLAELFVTLVTDSAYETNGGSNLVPACLQCSSANFADLTDAQGAVVLGNRKELKGKTPWSTPIPPTGVHTLLK